jgi:multiple sugar transport system permease protein
VTATSQTETLRAAGRRPAARRGGARRRRNTWIAWGFAAPFVVIFSLFMFLPIVSSFALSFTDMTSADIRNPLAVDFVAFDQYAKVLSDPDFHTAAIVTATFVVVGIPVTVAIALGLAVALNSGIRRARPLFRVIFYAPVVTSVVAVAVIWKYILARDGLLNMGLALVGVQGPDWLNDPSYALPALIGMAVWRNVGTLMVIFLAGLQSVPPELLEAATVDGAGAWRRFTGITMPLIRPTILLGSVLISIGYLQFFEEAFVMTDGGPLNSTLSATLYTFRIFEFGDYATASAASYIIFLAIVLVSILQFRILRRKT